jgi:segregation and condensation protein B
MNMEKMISAVESILFVSGEPVKNGKLMKILEIDKEMLERIIAALEEKYALASSGLMLLSKSEQLQLASKAENVEYVENLVKSELSGGLSPSAVEVLSIVAYRGPISKAEVEQIRGVNCSYTLRNLLMRGLIERGDNPKDSRGYVYTISFELLKKLGISDVKKLPDYATLSVDERVGFIIDNNQE